MEVRASFQEYILSSTTWVPGIQLKLSDLATNPKAVLLAPPGAIDLTDLFKGLHFFFFLRHNLEKSRPAKKDGRRERRERRIQGRHVVQYWGLPVCTGDENSLKKLVKPYVA